MTTPTTEPTRAQRSQQELELRNGGCIALSTVQAAGHCACELYELVGHADGFPTCVCGHTRWAHEKTGPAAAPAAA